MGAEHSAPKPQGTPGCHQCIPWRPNSQQPQPHTINADGGANEKLLDKYVLGKVLGQGAFGVVYSCKKRKGREEFAVKMIDQVETPLVEIQQEVDMLRKLAHKTVTKLYDVYYEKVFVCMVMECYAGGDMIEGMQLHWKGKGQIAIPVIQNISKMMVQSIEWLHSNSIVHRDLKGDNFLMDRKHLEHPDCRIFLSDFGTVVELRSGQRLKHKCGTKTYWAPEFYDLNYSFGVDIWAIGVIMFGLVTGRFPFKTEDDTKTKLVKCPARLTKEGETFIIGTLTRDEKKRLTSKLSLEHVFLSTVQSAVDKVEETMEHEPDLREGGANVGVQERRRELVERLAKAGGKVELITSAAQIQADFEVNHQFAEKRVKMEWWPAQKVQEEKMIDLAIAQRVHDMDSVVNLEASEEGGIRQMLEHHGIKTSEFGQGRAKEFSELVREVQCGQSRLMLDATKHKSVVRVVDLVLLRISYGKGRNQRFMVKESERLPDGRVRDNLNFVPGTKKMPHESGRQLAMHELVDRLNLKETDVSFDWTRREVFEQDEISLWYPGVRTVYRKEIFEGTLVTTDQSTLTGLGLLGRSSSDMAFSKTDAKQYTRSFRWLTEAECDKRGVKMRAPAEGAEISPLVHAPIGLPEEELQLFLQTSQLDLSQFGRNGTKSLKDLSEELIRGEAQLTRKPNGQIIRLVDVVIVKITKANGGVLVQKSETNTAGEKKELKRLPAVKRRPDENPFCAAKRVLENVLKISENLVVMDQKNVLLIEEETASKAYAGLPTIYRRLIIPTTLHGE